MKYSTGAQKSKYDIRTFSYKPTTAAKSGGELYKTSSIDDQSRVGICTAEAITMNATQALGIQFSADFQYLLQKKYINGNWNEGSSGFSACKVAQKYGMITEKAFSKYITKEDRKLTYSKYIKKLQAVPDDVIFKLLEKAVKIESYAKVPVDRDFLANAISNSKAGVITRYTIGREWWVRPVQPLRSPKKVISGHLVNDVKYDGQIFTIANSWGTDWQDDGHAIHNFDDYKPTEAWAVFYKETPPEVNQKVTVNYIIRLLRVLLKMDIITKG